MEAQEEYLAHGQRRLAEHIRDCNRTIGNKSSEDHPLPV
jgi:hypothetical protein